MPLGIEFLNPQIYILEKDTLKCITEHSQRPTESISPKHGEERNTALKQSKKFHRALKIAGIRHHHNQRQNPLSRHDRLKHRPLRHQRERDNRRPQRMGNTDHPKNRLIYDNPTNKMGAKIKLNKNIDKLKLCYYQPNQLFERLLNRHSIDGEGYSLFVLHDEREKKGKTPNHLCVNVHITTTNGDLQNLGTFTFHNQQSDFEGYAFFDFQNKAFYQHHKDGKNLITLIKPIAQALGLTFSHITALDIALDCNINLISKVRNLIKTHTEKGLEMVYNNRKITDPTKELGGWKEIYSRTCKRLIKTPSIYLTQKNDGPALCIYDKAREIASGEGEKQYINEWNNIGKRCYRAEIRLKRKEIRNYFAQHDTAEFSLEKLQEQETLSDIWQYFSHRILHFTRPSNRTTIEIADLLTA